MTSFLYKLTIVFNINSWYNLKNLVPLRFLRDKASLVIEECFCMSNFNNNEYESLASDFVGDIFYSNASDRAKISTIRKYGEVIVRKILDFDPDEGMTLGHGLIKGKIKLLPNHDFLESAIEVVLDKGNPTSHTKDRTPITSEELKKALDGLFDMLSFLLISYFEKYPFGSNPDVASCFSLLPPIIRYKVLSFLNAKYPDNIMIIDRLTLAMMKAFSEDEAFTWIEERKDNLSQISSMTDEAFEGISQKMGYDFACIIRDSAPNMYDLCRQKVEDVGKVRKSNSRIPQYSSFEEALPYYKQNGTLDNQNPENAEFNDIMNFLYLGRKEAVKKIEPDDTNWLMRKASLSE